MIEKHVVRAENAAKIWQWLHERGGIAVWSSANLSNLEAGWTTPACKADGSPSDKPSWQAGNTPRIITDTADVVVSFDKEVRRFRVAIRRGSQGLAWKVSDGGTTRIRQAVSKAGEWAYYIFDYDTQEAVIMVPERTIPLIEWKKLHD